MSTADNAFATLGIPVRLVWQDAEFEQACRHAAAAAHPDAGGNDDAFARVQQARSRLLSPSKRLIHWLELHQIPHEPRGTLDTALMDLFGKISQVCQQAEQSIQRREATQTALARAMMEPTILQCREQLSEAIRQVTEEIQRECNHFADFETALSIDTSSVCRCARNLAFLEKWQLNLKSLFARLA